MTSAEREPITGVWGPSPQRGPEAEPLVRGSGAKPPEAERFRHWNMHQDDRQKLPLPNPIGSIVQNIK